MRIEDTTICDCGEISLYLWECGLCGDIACSQCGSTCNACGEWYHKNCFATNEDYSYNICGECIENHWDCYVKS